MPTFIALYRGINVGGRALVKMDALRAMHESLLHTEVASYVQSGNVVFNSIAEPDANSRIRLAFEEQFGFAVTIFLRTVDQWATLIAANPYALAAKLEPSKVFLSLADEAIDQHQMSSFLERVGNGESIHFVPNAIYLHAPIGVGRSKFAAGMERAAGTPLSSRNWRTVLAIQSLAMTAAERISFFDGRN